MTAFFQKHFFYNGAKNGHFQALDGLRGLAVLIVLLSHTSNLNLFFLPFLNFAKIGKLGVYLFFILSAYLLDRQIVLAFINNRAGTAFWKNYFLRRFLRIFPLFMISLFVSFLFTRMGFFCQIDSFKDIIHHLTLKAGKGVFWSIPVEFKYYFLSPLLLYAFHRFFKWNLRTIIFFELFLIFASIFIHITMHLKFTSTVRFLPIFLVGTTIAIIELFKERELSNKKELLEFLGLLSFSVILITIPYYLNLLFNIEIEDFNHWAYYLIYSLLWGFFLLAAKYGIGMITKILEFPPLRFLGIISFSIYLFHVPLLVLINSLDFPPALKIYAFFLATVTFSSLSYLFIEKPLSKIRISRDGMFFYKRTPAEVPVGVTE